MDSQVSSKKKVLYVITKSNWGGAQRYVYDLATSLPKEEFDVAVMLGGSGPLAQKLHEADTAIYHSKFFGRDVSIIKDTKSFFELLKLFRLVKPDIVHLNSSKVGGLGSLAARIAGVPNIFFTIHGWPFLESRSVVAKALIWLSSWLTAVLCTKVICISEYDLRIAGRMPFIKGKAVRVYNGNEPMTFGTGEKIRSAFPADVKIMGTIGELNKNKNQQALIEQARNTPDMFVAIVGEGEERGRLEKKIKTYGLGNRVKLFGFIPAQEVLKGFDVFALPSLKEGLPYVLLEAKQAGLPIVANRVGGVGEILDSKDLKEFALEHMVEKTVTLYRSRS